MATSRLQPSDICGNWEPVATPEQNKDLQKKVFLILISTSIGNSCAEWAAKWKFARLVKYLMVKEGWNRNIWKYLIYCGYTWIASSLVGVTITHSGWRQPSRGLEKNMKSESGSILLSKGSENCISERPPIHIVCEQGVEDGEEKSCSFARAWKDKLLIDQMISQQLFSNSTKTETCLRDRHQVSSGHHYWKGIPSSRGNWLCYNLDIWAEWKSTA